MAGLDFRRASDLFMGREEELALALGISVADVRGYRHAGTGGQVPDVLMRKLGEVLVDRGRGMMRVGELLKGG
jgi:hypothetical protein